MIEPKRCPFCAGISLRVTCSDDGHYVECYSCNTRGPHIPQSDRYTFHEEKKLEARAIEAWNKAPRP